MPRPSVRLLAAVVTGALLSSPVSAQTWRISITPFVSHVSSGALTRSRTVETVNYPSAGGFAVRRTETHALDVDEGLSSGLRVDVQMRDGWRLFAEGAYAAGQMTFRQSSESRSETPGLMSASVTSFTGGADAAVSAFALGAAHDVGAGWGRLALEMGAAGTLRRYALDRRIIRCPPNAMCLASDPWPSRYLVPGVAGSLGLRWAATPRLGLEARSTLGAGRASRRTDDGSCFGLNRETCAPSARLVYDARFSLGASIRR